MASAYHQQANSYSHPPSAQDVRLPSIRDLHIYRPASESGQSDYGSATSHPSRYDPPPSGWARSASSASGPPLQHATSMTSHAPPSEPPKSLYGSGKSEGSYATPGMPLSAQMGGNGGNSQSSTRGDSAPQKELNRARSNSTLSETPGRSPHTPYPSHASYPSQPPPPSSYHQVSAPPSSHDSVHQTPTYSHPNAGYPQYASQAPQHMSRVPYAAPPNQPPVLQPPSHSSNSYPPPPPPNNWQSASVPQPSHHQLPLPHQPPPHHHQPPPSHQQPPSHHQPAPHHQPSSQHQPSSHHQPPPQHPPPSQHPPPQHQPSSQHQPLSQHQPPLQHQPPAAQQLPPQQHSYDAYARANTLVPTAVNPRNGAITASNATAVAEEQDKLAREEAISEIVRHCNALYSFANHYAASTQTQPTASELQEMNRHATTVVRLLDDLRRLALPPGQVPKEIPMPNGVLAAPEEPRPPKRPWEDMTRDDEPGPSSSNPAHRADYADEKMQSTAEQDMEIIRSKRATSTGNNAPGQAKSKYRKRSRATPPGKCHSCNIRETPEWRRGPDGARTLCNACGLHYAKLMRKRDKAAIGPDGKPNITIESLRASTASARGAEAADPSTPQQQPLPPPQSLPPMQPSPSHHHQSPHISSHYEHPQQKQAPPPSAPMHPPHHPSPHSQPHAPPYHMMTMSNSGPPPSGGPQQHHHQMLPPPLPPPPHGEGGVNVPPPPWIPSPSPSNSGRGGYAGEHQSYMRSHPPSHARASPN